MSNHADFFDVEDIFHHLDLQPGMIVADFGCGRDTSFVITAARMVGERGRVYAIDIVKDILHVVENHVELAGLHNVQTLWSDLEILRATRQVPDESVDVGLLVTTLYMAHDKQAMMQECVRMMKRGGKIFIADWQSQNSPFGPPISERVSMDEVQKLTKILGLHELEIMDCGAYHWGVVYEK